MKNTLLASESSLMSFFNSDSSGERSLSSLWWRD